MSDAPNPKISELLREGIRAARAGEKEKARELLQQVVDADQYSEQGWFWLASVVETDEERRTCLGNVVVINPDNLKAQELLERLEGMASGEYSATGEIIPGVDRRKSLAMIAIGSALLLVVCGVIFLTVLGGGDDDDGANDDAVGDVDNGQNGVDVPTLTATPQITNTPFPTLPPPPSETPRPSPTPPQATLQSPPEGMTGQIIIGSGDFIGRHEERNIYHDQPLFSVLVDDVSDVTPMLLDVEVRGDSPSLSPNGSRFVFTQYLRQGGPIIQVYNSDGTKAADLGDYWNRVPLVFEQRMPAWSPTGDQVVFVGRVSGGVGSNSDNLFLIDVPPTVPTFEQPVDEENPDAETETDPLPFESPLMILTDDTVNKLWPTWSPSGQQIVFVAETSDSTDLLVMNMSDGSIRELTTDGNVHVESAPDWGGPDDNFVIYSASSEDGSGTDIWIVSLDNLGDIVDTSEPDVEESETDDTETLPEGNETDVEAVNESDSGDDGAGEQIEESGPRLLLDFGPNDIQPRWSPDGRYIVFSSDRNGRRFDVFIYDFETGDMFKVTDDSERTDVAHEWVQ